jgi:hypothetical protein
MATFISEMMTVNINCVPRPIYDTVSSVRRCVAARSVPGRLSCFRRASLGEYPLYSVNFLRARKHSRCTYKGGSPSDTPVTLIL